MKNATIFGLALALFFPLLANAQSPEQLFQQGNQLYQQGDIAGARDAYAAVIRGGYENGEVYFNLGNAQYKLGNIPQAVLQYERARRYIPGDDDLLHNLQLVNLMLIDRIEPAPQLFLWEWWDELKGFFTLQGITWTAYGALFSTIAMVVVVILVPAYAPRKYGLIGSGVFGLLTLILLSIFAAKVSDDGQRDAAVVTAQIATAKNSPDAKSSDAFVLHGGVKVRVTDRVNEWIKIRIADGKVGWVEQSAVEII